MKAKLLMLFCLLGLGHFARGQSTVPEVLSTGGDFFSAGGNTLSITIGEMAAIETFSAGSSMLTQGFQQPDITGVGIAPVNLSTGDISLYPNPVSTALHVSFLPPGNGTICVRLFDARGREVIPALVSEVAGTFSGGLDLSAVDAGLYHVVFSFTDERGVVSRFSQTISVIH